MNNIESKSFINECALKVDSFLDKYLVIEDSYSSKLIESMRYSLFAGGKRIRASLLISSYSLFSDNIDMVVPFAAAVEMVHTYSLIHDDLPAMDDDDLRRGKPTNHKVYGEALAILSGDALVTKAFELINDRRISPSISDTVRVDISTSLSVSSGDKGMIAGQVADILYGENSTPDKSLLQYIHMNKSTELIKASILIGARLANADEEECRLLSSYGDSIGLAFQIQDDILDITSSKEVLGKTAGKDVVQSKLTYPSLFGLDESKRILNELLSKAKDDISFFGDRAKVLNGISDYIIYRDK